MSYFVVTCQQYLICSYWFLMIIFCTSRVLLLFCVVSMLTNTVNGVAIFVLSSKFVASVCTCLSSLIDMDGRPGSSVSVTLSCTFLKVLVFPYTLHWGEVLLLYWQNVCEFQLPSLRSPTRDETQSFVPLCCKSIAVQQCSQLHRIQLKHWVDNHECRFEKSAEEFHCYKLVSLYVIRDFHCLGNEDQTLGCDDVLVSYLFICYRIFRGAC
jgi:hypothetical protein